MNKQLKTEKLPREEILREWPGFKNCRTALGDCSDLKATIITNGMISPPIVWKTENEDGERAYVLLAGYRRMHCLSEIVEEVDGAAEMYENISCTVYEGDLDGAIVVNLLENVERDDLNPADAADGVVALMERIGNQERVGARMGKSQGWVSKYLILGTCLCARGKDALRAGAISLKQAKSLTDFIKRDKTPDEEKQHQLLDRWLTGNKEGDESTAPASKRERTMRTRADVEALRARLTKLEDNDCDPLHKASLQTFAAWFFCEIEEGDVLIRQAPEEPRVLASEPEEAPATKKRVREEKHVEKEEPKQPKLLPKKKEK